MLKAGRITRIVNLESWSELAELDSQFLLISASIGYNAGYKMKKHC